MDYEYALMFEGETGDPGNRAEIEFAREQLRAEAKQLGMELPTIVCRKVGDREWLPLPQFGVRSVPSSLRLVS